MWKALGFRARETEPELTGNASHIHLLEDALSLEQGLQAMDLVMDDRPSEAQVILNSKDQRNSTYFKLVRGVIAFLEATLGFEAEAIRHAVETLYETEQAAWKARQRAVRNNDVTSSYAPGTEYHLAYAEAHLMGAISMLLSESYLDSAKALLKLRRAFQTLDEIHKMIHFDKPELKTVASRGSFMLGRKKSVGDQPKSDTIAGDPQIQSLAAQVVAARRARHKLENKGFETPPGSSGEEESLEDVRSQPHHAGFRSVDEYIESGVSAMFGILQLVISIIPPTLGKVLSIVGFHGSKEQGINMLWHAAKTLNIHGSIALLALLQFYDGPTQFSDIQMPERLLQPSYMAKLSDESNPIELGKIKDKLEASLKLAILHYPRGALWKLQWGRMLASQRQLPQAVEVMDEAAADQQIEMDQVAGLMLFDKNILLLTLHRFPEAAKNYIELLDLNTWSHGLYVYMSAGCHVELYRALRDSDPNAADSAKQQALQAYERMNSLKSNKRFMAKPMPFDLFVSRKMSQLKSLVSENPDKDLVDVSTTSPILEALYFWNGYGRMPPEMLERSLKCLGYSGRQETPHSQNRSDIQTETDHDALTRYLVTSCVLRYLNRVSEAIALLDNTLLPMFLVPLPAASVKKNKSGLVKYTCIRSWKDPWAPPSALYERAICEWAKHGTDAIQQTREYLDMASHWSDDYELSTRVTMKIKSAVDRLNAIESTLRS